MYSNLNFCTYKSKAIRTKGRAIAIMLSKAGAISATLRPYKLKVSEARAALAGLAHTRFKAVIAGTFPELSCANVKQVKAAQHGPLCSCRIARKCPCQLIRCANRPYRQLPEVLQMRSTHGDSQPVAPF